MIKEISSQYQRIKDSVLPFMAFRLAPSLLYFLTMDDKSFQRVQEAREQLDNQPNTSFIVAPNHFSIVDPFIATWLLFSLDPQQKRAWCAPVSYHHMNPEFKGGKTLRGIVEKANALGIHTYPIVQKYQVGKLYSQELATETYNSFRTGINSIRETKPVGLLLFPEGTRSLTGIFGAVERGIEYMQHLLAPTIVVPLAISYVFNKFHRDGINLFHPVKLSVGKLGMVETSGDRIKAEEVGRRIAAVLPESMRGQWK